MTPKELTMFRFIPTVAVMAAAILVMPSALSSASAEIVIAIDKSTQSMSVIVDGDHRYTWPFQPASAAHPAAVTDHNRWTAITALVSTAARRCRIRSSTAATSLSTVRQP